jgi:hypothetical protein
MSSPPQAMAPRRLAAPEKARLLGEVLHAYAMARLLLARRDLRETLSGLRDGDDPARDPLTGADQLECARLAAVVQRVLGRLPLDSRCLMQSLVLTRLLSRRGLRSTLVIGVRPGERFGAHAWVELRGRPLLPPGGDDFERLVDL